MARTHPGHEDQIAQEQWVQGVEQYPWGPGNQGQGAQGESQAGGHQKQGMEGGGIVDETLHAASSTGKGGINDLAQGGFFAMVNRELRVVAEFFLGLLQVVEQDIFFVSLVGGGKAQALAKEIAPHPQVAENEAVLIGPGVPGHWAMPTVGVASDQGMALTKAVGPLQGAGLGHGQLRSSEDIRVPGGEGLLGPGKIVLR